MRQKNLARKSWYHTPLLLGVCWYRKISETQSFPLGSFKVLWDKKFSTENCDSLSFSPLWSIKLFDARIFMKHRWVSLQNVAVLWHRTFPTEFHDLHLFCANIVDKRNFLNYWSVPLRNNSALWDKTISTKSCDTSPPPSYPWKYKISEVFWNTEWFAYEVFWYCEIRNFWRKIVIFHLSLSPLLSLKLCDKGIFLKNRRVPVRSISVLWVKNIATENYS